MSTNATIGMVNNTGEITSIYLHWDGDRAGKTLVQYYTDPAKVAELISLGACSVLDKNIGEKIDFDDRDARDRNQQCLFYGRDRNDPGMEAAVDKNIDDFLNNANTPYTYLFDNGQWLAWKQGHQFELAGQGHREPVQQEMPFEANSIVAMANTILLR